MTSSRRPSSRATKRQRREARAQAARLEAASTKGGRGGPSTITLLTVGVVAVAAVAILAFAFLNSGGGSTAPVASPAVLTPASIEHGRSLGDPNAPVKLDLWADFQCPACRAFTTNIEPLLVAAYLQTGKADLTFHDFWFIGPESEAAAIAARCADQQGKFWLFHDYLYGNQGATENSGAFSAARLDVIAGAVGLDRTKFDACTADASIKQAVDAESAQGRALGVNQTPTIFVNGVMASTANDYTTVSKAIDAALAGGSSSPSPSASASATP